MKVKELIEKLQKMDQELEVMISNGENRDLIEIGSIIGVGYKIVLTVLPDYVPDDPEGPETWADGSEMED